MAPPPGWLKCSELDGGEVPDSVAAPDGQLQQWKSKKGAEGCSSGAQAGMMACQHNRYKNVAGNRRCFGPKFSPEFRG
jgi:hypothetical protein